MLNNTIRKNSKEIKELLKNLDNYKLVQWIYPNEKEITKNDVLNFFNKEYGSLTIEKYAEYYSIHTGITFYRIYFV